MSETYPVETTPDRPEIQVRVAGEELEPTARLDVLEVDVTEEINRHGRATLLLRNWDEADLTVTHSESDQFAPGAEIEILLGYREELTTVFDGVVVGLDARFGGGAGPTLLVHCRTRSILLDAPPRSRVFEDTSDGDIASELASAHSLSADSSDGITQPAVVQQRISDWRHLVARAERLGFVTYVRGDTLVFREPTTDQGEAPSLRFGRTLLELDIHQALGHRHDPTTATAWDVTELAAIDSEAPSSASSLNDGDRPDATDALEAAGWAERAATEPTSAPLDPLEVERVAARTADRQTLKHISGRGRTIGLPQLQADSWLVLEDVGVRFAGAHYVSAVRHRLGRNGYNTEFQLGLPERLLPPSEPIGSGLLLGVVEDLDDPDGQARVKVGFPWRADAPDAVWARLATLDAGPEQGTLFMPDVGQEVVVAHVDDDHRFPVVLGALWNGQQAPPESVDPDANDIRMIRTRSGHKLRFDDADPGSVVLETAGGRLVELLDGDELVRLTDASGNSLTIDRDGITLEATTGDINLKAAAGKVKVDTSGFEAKSTGPAKVESTATLDLKASASLSVNGALVRIN